MALSACASPAQPKTPATSSSKPARQNRAASCNCWPRTLSRASAFTRKKSFCRDASASAGVRIRCGSGRVDTLFLLRRETHHRDCSRLAARPPRPAAFSMTDRARSGADRILRGMYRGLCQRFAAPRSAQRGETRTLKQLDLTYPVVPRFASLGEPMIPVFPSEGNRAQDLWAL